MEGRSSNIHAIALAGMLLVFLVGPVSADPLDELPPAPPWGLTVTPHEEGYYLSWNAPAANGSADVQGYVVYRSEDGNAFHAVAFVEVESYLDPVAGMDAVIMYAVSAVSEVGESPPTMMTASDYPYCNVIEGTPGPPFVVVHDGCLLPPPVCCPPLPPLSAPDQSFFLRYIPCTPLLKLQGTDC